MCTCAKRCFLFSFFFSQIQHMRRLRPVRDAGNIKFPTKTKRDPGLTAPVEAETGTSSTDPNKQQTNRKLSEVWNELGQNLKPPPSLIEAAYVCHELLSSNIWGCSQPSNS